MTKYREILKLSSLEFSKRNIALSCSVSRNTVAKVLNTAKEANISWLLDESQTDKVLEYTVKLQKYQKRSCKSFGRFRQR